MNQEVEKHQPGIGAVERVLIGGDLSQLSETDRLAYYKATCESLGLNPLTKPFDYIELNNKLVLYAKRDCTDQLRKIHNISVKITNREVVDGVFVVTSQAKTPEGREDESVGAVPLVKDGGAWRTSQGGKRFFESDGTLVPLRPEDRANAIMKAETKAKRRVTLSICGLGMLDESEFDTIAELKGQASKIDTGGHAVGTQAAADAVAQRKLAEIADDKPDIPDALIVIFDTLAEPGAVTAAFTEMKLKFETAWPGGHGLTTYQRIVKAHGMDKKGATIVQAKTGLTEMWRLLQQVAKPEPVEAK